MAEVILLGLVPAQDTNLTCALIEQAPYDCLAERAGATGYEHTPIL
jgi:hypothetical protein